MKVETKYNIGDEVYIVYKDKKEAIIIKDKISSIVIEKGNKISYYLENQCDEFEEKEIVLANEEQLLIKQIKDILNKESKNSV